MTFMLMWPNIYSQSKGTGYFFVMLYGKQIYQNHYHVPQNIPVASSFQALVYHSFILDKFIVTFNRAIIRKSTSLNIAMQVGSSGIFLD